MNIEKWRKIKTERVYDGFKKINKITFKLPDGKLKDFDVAVGRAVVSVVGLTKDKKVVLTKQYRPGPNETFYEFSLGFVEEGETPLEAAEREFLEETGYQGELKQIGVAYHSAYSEVKVYCCLATNCEKITDKLKLDEGEFIEVHLFPVEEVRKMLLDGRIRNFGEGYLALDYLGLL